MHWEDPEGSGGKWGGRGDRDGEYMYIHGWFMSMYDKNHYNKKREKNTKELYKKALNDPDNHDDVVTPLEPDILN